MQLNPDPQPHQNDEDAVQERRGRPWRDFCYLMSTNQNFDRPEALDVLRDKEGLLGLGVFFVTMLAGMPGVLSSIPFFYAAYRFGRRYWFLSPASREEGSRHVLVVFEASGYWHVAEYIRGLGEVVKVMTDGTGYPVAASTATHVFEALATMDWGHASSDDAPRKIVRKVKTYRRRPTNRWPFATYPKNSVGFAAHVLGIHDLNIRTPKQLLDYCERAGDIEAVDLTEAMSA